MLLLWAALAFATPAAAGAPEGVSKECGDFISSLPSDVAHGFVTVPLNWSTGQGEARVFYYGRFTGTGTPVAVVNGGTGASSWRLFGVRMSSAAALSGVPVVFFDQRGNGCSTPYPAPDSPDAGAWASDSIVRDMEAIRRALYGDKPWRVFGQSFGSVVVHRYVTLAPQSLRAAYAHGFALREDWRDYRRIHRQYWLSIQERFFKAHPKDRRRLRAAFSRLAARDCPAAKTPEEKLACARPYAAELSLSFRPDDWAKTHASFELFLSSEPSRREPPKPVEASPLSARDLAIHTIVTQEYLPPGFDPQDPFACGAAHDAMLSRHDWRDLLFLSDCDRYEGELLALYRSNAPRATSYLSLSAFAAALRANPGLRFRLYSGELDPHSPPPYFEDEARLLKDRISYSVIAGGGHFDWGPIFADLRSDP